MTGPALQTQDIRHPSRIFRGPAEIALRHRESSDARSAQGRSTNIRARVVRAWRWILGAKQQEAMDLAASIMHELHELDGPSAQRYRAHLHLIRAVDRALSDDPEGLLLELDNPLVAGLQVDLTRTLLRFVAFWEKHHGARPPDE